MVEAQMRERQSLQAEIKTVRSKHAQALLDLHSDTANYRLMNRGEAPKPRVRDAFERLEALREKAQQAQHPERQQSAAENKPALKRKPQTPEERLKALRERRQSPSRSRGPEMEP